MNTTTAPGMDLLHHLHLVAPTWPALPDATEFVPDDEPLPAGDWPDLTLTWWDIPPTVLHPDRHFGARTDSLLHAEGAPAPVALVSWAPVTGARYGRGWLWRCEVHVTAAPGETGFNYDCPTTGRSTTRDGARDAAAAHLRSSHPDAAVPYLGRRQHAFRRWI
ncbi:hypothetical protein [Streptomyces europaeiscabiei]|uniref:hypothetical protein n=1 Tax=Streptomyces europaeiscabiei TaxID=146819 RepID=UPI002E160485|nr:hypothetical protein OHB30_33105 [Streptomyces europaeiscabiei]